MFSPAESCRSTRTRRSKVRDSAGTVSKSVCLCEIPRGLADSQIAGIAKSHDFSLSTLNLRDFDKIDLAVIEPR